MNINLSTPKQSKLHVAILQALNLSDEYPSNPDDAALKAYAEFVAFHLHENSGASSDSRMAFQLAEAISNHLFVVLNRSNYEYVVFDVPSLVDAVGGDRQLALYAIRLNGAWIRELPDGTSEWTNAPNDKVQTTRVTFPENLWIEYLALL